MSFHTAIAATSKGELNVIQLPTRTPNPSEVRIRVEYAAVVAFDTYVVDQAFPSQNYPCVLGLTATGTIAECGLEVDDLSVGDRVAAYTFGANEHKGMQEYVTLPRNVVAKIPESLSLAEAATIPNTFATAFYTLFNQLGLPIPPSFPATTPPPLATTPILISGASSATGVCAVQLLALAGYTNIIGTASPQNHARLCALGAACAIDYNSATVVDDIRAAVGGDGGVRLAVDCIAAEDTTLEVLSRLMSADGRLAILLPIKGVGSNGAAEMLFETREEKIPFLDGVERRYVRTFNYQQDEHLRNHLMPNILPRLLSLGKITPSPVQLMDEGSFKERVESGFQLLKNNKASGKRVIVKVIP